MSSVHPVRTIKAGSMICSERQQAYQARHDPLVTADSKKK